MNNYLFCLKSQSLFAFYAINIFRMEALLQKFAKHLNFMHKIVSWKIQPTFNSFLLNSLLKSTSCNKFQWNVLWDVEMDHKWIFLRNIASELRHSNNNCEGAMTKQEKLFSCSSRRKKKDFLSMSWFMIFSHLAIIRQPQYRVHALIFCAHVITNERLAELCNFSALFFSCFLRAKCLQSFHYYLKTFTM